MALPKQHPDLPDEQPATEAGVVKPDQSPPARLFGPAERLRAIFDDLREHAPPEGEDDGWEELVEALDAERPEGMKLFPK